MTELEIVTRLAPDVRSDDAYARSAQEHAAERLRGRIQPPRGRQRLRPVLLACAFVLAAISVLLVTRVGGGESAVARATAALDLPRTGIFVLDSHSYGTKPSGAVRDSHYAVWQDLGHPSDHRALQTDPDRGTLSDRSTLGHLSMRYDREANVVYTQRVIVSPHAALTADARATLGDQQRLRRLLGSGRMHDRGTVRQAGHEYRRLTYTYGPTSCDYLVDPVSYRPARLDCLTRAGGGGDRVHDVVTYRVAAPTRSNDRMLDLRAAYPLARVEHDPAGIPGRAGDRLADVTQPARYTWTGGAPVLQRTDNDALRAVQKLQARAFAKETDCLVRHGVPFAHGGYSDPIGTVTAICAHLYDDALALTRTPAAVELTRRNLVAVGAAHACIRKRLHGARLGTSAGNAVARGCARSTRDPIAGGFEAPSSP